MSQEATQAAAALFNPLSDEFRADPYPFYARIREAGAAVRTPFGSTLVTRYEDVDRVLKSAQFRTPRGYRDPDDPAGPARFDPSGAVSKHRRLWLLFQTGEPHSRLRRLITKVFTPRAVSVLTPRIERLVEALLEPALARGSMEVIADLAYPLPATVICELLGIPESERDVNRRWSTAIAPTLEVMMTDEQHAAAERAMAEWDAYIRAFLAERRTRPGEALIDAMLAVEDGGARLSEDEIVANTTFLFLAGHETTTNLIGNGLLALLRRPDQLAILRAEPRRIEGAIEELLRFDSPVQFAGRVSDSVVEVAGVRIEPGTNVMLGLGCANHDPRRFAHPDELDVTREDVKPLSFGGGAHYCVGAALARLEGKIAFGRLFERTKKLELATERPRWRPSLGFRALEALPITVEGGPSSR
jgi:cytochrome P450